MNMDNAAKGQIILDDYKKKSDEIIDKMLTILMRAGRKADNANYQKILDKVDREIQTS